MYTVGQVAKFLGISRDTLKFYEEKNLINPMQDEENGYRKYNLIDINEVLTINFYRDIDIEIKKIQEIKAGDNIDTIDAIMAEKEKKLEEDIEHKKILLKRIKDIKRNCQAIEENLNKFTIKEMNPIAINSEIEMKREIDNTCNEILQKYDYSTRIKKAVNLSDISRIVYFNNTTITKERYVFFEKLEDTIDETREVISYPKCMYIVIEIPIAVQGKENIDENMAETIIGTAKKLGYETLGVSFINLLFNGYKQKENVQYLEIYTPVK